MYLVIDLSICHIILEDGLEEPSQIAAFNRRLGHNRVQRVASSGVQG